MDRFTGFKTAAAEQLPDAVMVPSTSPGWPPTPWTGTDAGYSLRSTDTVAPRPTRWRTSTGRAHPTDQPS